MYAPEDDDNRCLKYTKLSCIFVIVVFMRYNCYCDQIDCCLSEVPLQHFLLYNVHGRTAGGYRPYQAESRLESIERVLSETDIFAKDTTAASVFVLQP